MGHIHPSTEIATVPQADAKPPHTPLMPERTEFLEGDAPAAAKVEAFLANALAASENASGITGKGQNQGISQDPEGKPNISAEGNPGSGNFLETVIS